MIELFVISFIATLFILFGFNMFSNAKRDEYIARNMTSLGCLWDVSVYKGKTVIIMPDQVWITNEFTSVPRRCVVERNSRRIQASVEFSAKEHWNKNKLSMLLNYKRRSK